jgi:hypothetical protein
MASTVTKGFASRLGTRQASAWNTALLLGANHQNEFVSESLTPDAQLIPDESLAGKATQLEGDKGNEFHAGDVVADLRYEGLEVLIANVFGTAGVPAQVLTDNAYKHVYKPADNKEGKFFTLAIDKVIDVWEYPTCKAQQLTLDIVPNRRARCTFGILPGKLNIGTTTPAGQINKLDTLGSLSLPANRDFALFSQLAIRMNLHDGAALANTDLVYVNEFHLTATNNFPTDDVTTRYGYLIDEPIQDGYTEFTASITFSKYMSDNRAFVGWMLSKQRLKMDVTLTGPVGAGMGTTPFSIALYAPNVQVLTAPPNIAGPGRVPFTCTFKLSRRTAVPTGFPTGYSDAVTWEQVNQRNTDPLSAAA